MICVRPVVVLVKWMDLEDGVQEMDQVVSVGMVVAVGSRCGLLMGLGIDREVMLPGLTNESGDQM